ncbi:MAG: hypothetical protein IT379_08190, partial [Deltaproteobacteria bacterium]|nr:hypothetical protein [Deltaproteobacteria bacterium]
MGSEDIGEGTLRTTDGRVLPLERTDVRARIGGPVATVEVRQHFRNTTPEAIEAVYTFPLPHEASVHRMELRIADRVVRAVVKEKEEARRTYERAKSEGRAATLLEQDRPSLFTLSVANVPPDASIEVRLEYQEAVAFDDGQWRFVFPLVAPERYLETPESSATPGAAFVPSQSQSQSSSGAGAAAGNVPVVQRPPRMPSGKRADVVSLEVELRTDGAVEAVRCPSHRVDIEPLEGGAARVKLHPDGIANRDFVLTYRASAEGVRPHVWFAREKASTGTFLLVLAPPSSDAPKTEARGAGAMKAITCGNCGGVVTDLSSIKEIPGLGSVVRCTFCGALLAP